MLLFTVVSAYLGLVRAAYNEKYEYFGSLATNMLRSSQRALEAVQKTNEYVPTFTSCCELLLNIHFFLLQI